MRRHTTLLLNLAITLSLAFSGMLSEILIATPVATGASNAPIVAPGDVTPDLASRRVKRERRHDRAKKDREQDRKQKDRKADRKQKDKKKDRKRDRSGPAAGSEVSVEDRYIVVLKDSTDNPAHTAGDMATDGVEPTHVYEHVLDGFAAIIPEDQLEDVRSDPRVKAVVPDREVHAFQLPLPTGIDRIDADRNSTAKIDGIDDRVDVDVAVVDTGIATHSDLIVAGGVSCISGNSSYADDNGHGTHVAGTIGALDDSIGVVGVAPGARLWAVKVLNSKGSGTWSSVICGLDWIAANSGTIDVANMSLGGDGSDSTCSGNDALHRAICRVVSAGVPVVVAAGNSSRDAAGAVPAAYDEVITVSALADSDGRPGGEGPATSRGPDDSLASFSNFGADIDIAAPGVSILSTVPGGYARFSGTSMAAPHVAGAAALYLANFPDATPAQVRTALQSVREAIALPNDRDGINEGVLYAGDGAAPPPTAVDTPPPATGGTIAPTNGADDKKKDKNKKKGKHKKGKKKRR